MTSDFKNKHLMPLFQLFDNLCTEKGYHQECENEDDHKSACEEFMNYYLPGMLQAIQDKDQTGGDKSISFEEIKMPVCNNITSDFKNKHLMPLFQLLDNLCTEKDSVDTDDHKSKCEHFIHNYLPWMLRAIQEKDQTGYDDSILFGEIKKSVCKYNGKGYVKNIFMFAVQETFPNAYAKHCRHYAREQLSKRHNRPEEEFSTSEVEREINIHHYDNHVDRYGNHLLVPREENLS